MKDWYFFKKDSPKLGETVWLKEQDGEDDEKFGVGVFVGFNRCDRPCVRDLSSDRVCVMDEDLRWAKMGSHFGFE